MPASFASCIERVEPERVALTEHQRARLRVVGSAFGIVRCGDERRWVWGRFDESFVITNARASVHVSVWGLGGRAVRRVPCPVKIDLRPPGARVITRRLAFRPPLAPRLRPLRIEQLPSSEETT